MNKEQPIGVFDSGIGGLSVLRQLFRFMPYERYIYLGDTARVPYGNKSKEIVNIYSQQCTEFLLEKGVKLVVVACNTASSVAMDAIRKTAGDIPVIGVIAPAAQAALRATVNGKIGVIGTRATIGSDSYAKSIRAFSDSGKIKVISKACPLFVPIVEEGWTEHKAAGLIADDYLQVMKDEKADTLVLGCTHYPMLHRLLTELLPGVHLIDSGEHAAVTALRLLADNNILADEKEEYVMKPEIDFYVTDLPAQFFELARQFLGFSVDGPQKVNLE